jgi:hypothetical protein
VFFPEDFHYSTKAMQALFLFSGEPFSISSIDIGLVDPLVVQRLGGNVQATGDF